MDEQTPQEHQTILGLVTRFFTIPLIIVIICIGIFYFFGRIAHDKLTIEDYLNEIRSGSANRRWQAAYELSKKVRVPEVQKEYGLKIYKTLSSVYYKELNEEDPRLRQYAVMTLAGLNLPEAKTLFKDSLKDKDKNVVFYTIAGIGSLKEPELAFWLKPYLKNEDPGIRSIAAYALGALKNKDSISWLKDSLKDSVADVQWNSALALAQMKNSAGLQVLHQLLDPTYLNQFPKMNRDARTAVIESALKGIILLNDKTALPLLEELAKTVESPSLLEQIRKTIDTLS